MSRDTSDRCPTEDGERTNAADGSAGTAAAIDDLRSRIAAVERACTGDADADLTDLADAAEATAELRRASTRLDDLEARVAELESATQALRGYVGSIRAVNERVEQRADQALAATRETADRDGQTRTDPDRGSSPRGSPGREPSTGDGAASAETPSPVGPADEGRPARSSGRDAPGGPDSPRSDSGWEPDRATDPTDRADDPTDDDAPLVERLRDAL